MVLIQMRLCKYNRNTITGKCNPPCYKSTKKVPRSERGQCDERPKRKKSILIQKKKTKVRRCAANYERVRIGAYRGCVPACESRNPFTKRCGQWDPDETEDALFTIVNGREAQTGIKFNF